MKELLMNYEVFYVMIAVSTVSLLAKCIGVLHFRRLLRESGQMATTGNRRLKSMMAKFEAYYKLRISVHNVANFVDRYLYHYRFLGVSLKSWENAGWYGSAGVACVALVSALLGGLVGLSEQWFLTLGLLTVLLLIFQAMAELILRSHRHNQLFRIQLIDYMENTMRAKLENEYFHEEESLQYQMEYFESEEENEKSSKEENKEAADELAKAEEMPKKDKQKKAVLSESSEMKELLTSLLAELQVDKAIQQKQETISKQGAASQRASLFEEVLKEYM